MKSLAPITLRQADLQEIFALFSSPADEERAQAYDKQSDFYFEKNDLTAEYSLNEERKEFAVDAWRAVTYYLYRHAPRHQSSHPLVRHYKSTRLWPKTDGARRKKPRLATGLCHG